MRRTAHLSRSPMLRPLAAALALALALVGVLPTLHHHEPAFENACHDGSHPVPHIAAAVVEHHELCALCTKVSSQGGLGQLPAVIVGDLDSEKLHELPGLFAGGPRGRHGSSRAPPAA